MAEPPDPPPKNIGYFTDPKTGKKVQIDGTDEFYRWLENQAFSQNAQTTQIGGILSGNAELLAAQQAAEANAQAQLAAANQAASAAISAGGSTETDYDADEVGVSSGTYATVITNTLNHAGGGSYDISALLSAALVVTDAPLMTGGLSFAGEWRIIENPGANVLFAGGTFTVTSSPGSEGGGVTFYENGISFGTALPFEAPVADAGSGAVTVELQLRRASGSNTVSGLYASMLTEWA